MESTVSLSGRSEPLRILSLDGGGIRGISSLLILEKIMEKIRDVKHLDRVPRPCDHFDLIGGTSTGGIIAIMLGRLGLTVDECIRAYRKVAQQAFTRKWTSILPASPSGAFSAQALEEAIKQTVREFCTDGECVTRRRQGSPTTGTCPHSNLAFRDQACTKTVVLAITKSNVDAKPTLFETYGTSADLKECTIWQVARATSAATTFFKSIKVGRDAVEYIDAGFGYNNPCDELITEARRVFPDHQELQVLSIGTGLGDVVNIKDTRMSIIDGLKKMAGSSKKVATSMNERFGDSGQYFRFNVDRGLEDITLSDWEKASTISAHTRNYLSEQTRAIERFVDFFTRAGVLSADRSGIEPTYSDISKIQQANSQSQTHYVIPSIASHHFTGRVDTLSSLKHKIFFQKKTYEVALFGLGGAGKTQVALQLAYWAKEHMPGHSIFWVSASSEGSFKQAYSEIARQLAIHKATDDETVMQLVQRYLSSEAAGPWLLIVDNADNLELLFGSADVPGLYGYLPDSRSGVMLLTTRSREVAVSFAERDIIEIQKMMPAEATALFEKVVDKALLCGRQSTAQLLEELNLLPLAITQAAAYMNRNNILTSRYLELMHGTEHDRIGLMSRHFHDHTRYPDTVATTWLISFKRIRESDAAAAELLAFISFIEPKAIPRSLLPPLCSEEQMEFAIGTLCDYAFMTKRDDGKVFDMHSLVQLATRLWVQKEEYMQRILKNTTRHIAVAFPLSDWANRELWRAYLPHALTVLWKNDGNDIEERYELCYKIGMCLLEDGRTKDAIRCFREDLKWKEKCYDIEHPLRLRAQHELARAYQADGQIKSALDLLEHVVAIRQKTLAEEDTSRLNSQHELARAYQADGQTKRALELLEYVVAIRERTLSENHKYRLSSQHELARAYQVDGQIKRAVKLLEHVVTVRKRTMATDHPDLLLSQQVLATVYHSDGQNTMAVKLLEHVVAVRQNTFNQEHPSQLASLHQLAGVYQADGQIQKALGLLEYVVTVRGRTLAEGHPSRLASQHVLARAYQADGQTKKAVGLLEHVVALREKTLAEGHPDRLASQHVLAAAYQADGQIKKAVGLLEHVAAVREKILPKGHVDRLTSQHVLAAAYEADGDIMKAVELLQLQTAIRHKVPSGENPSTLTEAQEDSTLRAAIETQNRSVQVTFGGNNSGIQIGVNNGAISMVKP
ncbi:uncharacterized protein N7484_003075 [Penicillium longicatenatum]|uniref:uncharacterized protein n=1 Tax=Penicillium longicatenatum TaxID=1561947 RepID=UPI002548F458|nr:uncharacterized protein N7484_003075 [Penicillium longicatenatum]KAJ5649352.1 hypothetical protein N7484_003075 [Penicillium longicatenatum]